MIGSQISRHIIDQSGERPKTIRTRFPALFVTGFLHLIRIHFGIASYQANKFKKINNSTMIGWEIRIDSSREKHKDCNHRMDMSGPKLQERGKKLLVSTGLHGGHVGGQEQKHFSSLGSKLYFDVNVSRTKFRCIDPQHGCLVTWTTNRTLKDNKSSIILSGHINAQ